MTPGTTGTSDGTTTGTGTSRRSLRVQVKLTNLASPPSPAELRAIELGIERALPRFGPEPADLHRSPGRVALLGTMVAATPGLGADLVFPRCGRIVENWGTGWGLREQFLTIR